MTPRPPRSTLFPYPTLFGSQVPRVAGSPVIGPRQERCEGVGGVVAVPVHRLGAGEHHHPAAGVVGPEELEADRARRIGPQGEIGRAHDLTTLTDPAGIPAPA